jgi:ABC-type microcin C transport system permease subunit YejB
MFTQMQKARRYAIIVVGFAIGAFLTPYLLMLLFVAVAFVAEKAHL